MAAARSNACCRWPRPPTRIAILDRPARQPRDRGVGHARALAVRDWLCSRGLDADGILIVKGSAAAPDYCEVLFSPPGTTKTLDTATAPTVEQAGPVTYGPAIPIKVSLPARPVFVDRGRARWHGSQRASAVTALDSRALLRAHGLWRWGRAATGRAHRCALCGGRGGLGGVAPRRPCRADRAAAAALDTATQPWRGRSGLVCVLPGWLARHAIGRGALLPGRALGVRDSCCGSSTR